MQRHEATMRRALELAERGWGHVSPNPMVGCVVVAADGEVVGEGWYESPRGAPHAEVLALRHAGDRARGATLYVTLEPCDHHGSTPPCTEAVMHAGVAEVVVAAGDPNPLVDGRGFSRLRDAGIPVHPGILEDEARRLNVAFERHVTTGLPFVIVKSAASMDGKTAAADGSSQWITSPAARADAQRLRAWADAVIVGAGTAIEDDPALTVREPALAGASKPLRVVVDSSGRVPATGSMFDDAAPTLVATTALTPEARVAEWSAAGAEVVVVDTDAAGRVSLGALFEALGKRDVQGVLVEGGATLAWSLARDGLINRFVLYLAPAIVGGAGALSVVEGEGFVPASAALPMTFTRVERVGPDIRVEADVHRDR